MKKIIILLLLLIAASNEKVIAQGQPAYWVDTTNPGIDRLQSWHEPFDWGANISQSIYYKNDFPTMPWQGYITEVFIKIAFHTPAGASLHGLRIKMGITDRNEYSPGAGDPEFRAIDSILTVVYYDSFYVLPAALPANSWWKLTLPQPYQYSMLPLSGDVRQNLVVQLSADTNGFTHWSFHFNTYVINYKTYPLRTLTGFKYPNNDVNIDGAYFTIYLIGFNGYALSVDDPQKKIPFSVFPNPAKDHVFLPGATGNYSIYNLTGIKVAEGNFSAQNSADVSQLSSGMYLLKADGKTYKFTKQ